MKAKQAGFTLVEIAIVLVIIGLLLGGVLKGQELINSAKVKNMSNDFRSISTMIYQYQDRFRAIPGDDPAAAIHVLNGTSAAPPGAAPGIIDGPWFGAAVTNESHLFWQHVRLANLATGTTDINAPDYIPRNAEGGVIGVTGANPCPACLPAWPGNHYVCSDNIQGRFARQIDTTMDDGITTTGSIRVIAAGTVPGLAFVNLTPANDAALFAVCFSL